MLGFWIMATAIAVVTIAILGRAMIAGGKTDAGTAEYDVQVYRDQLSELDRDVARGVISEEEAVRARVETSRRLLEADRRAQSAQAPDRAPKALTWTVLALSAAVILGGGFGLYRVAGAPGTPDLPLATRIELADMARAERPSQEALEADLPDWAGPPPEAPADYLDMVDKLRAAVETRPDDLEGQHLLAQHEGALGNYRAAHRAMARVIALEGDDASADDYTTYADLMVLAASGVVSPEAETAVRKALDLAPKNGIALYYLGLMYGQNDRPDLGFPVWRNLLETSGKDDPWVGPIRSQIGQLASMAGVDYTPPVAAPAGPFAGPFTGPNAGPSAADMDAAADMSDEDRSAMIQGMVNQLMDRLASEGGTAQEWAQLIRALTVVGDTEKARGIWGEALAVFEDTPEAVTLITQTAQGAGLESPLTFDPNGATTDTDTDTGTGTGTDAGTGTGTGSDTAAAPDPQPEAAPGPDADDIAAAAEMSDEDRAAMIDGMVTRLSDELATNGGPPEKWVMLLKSLGQLGEADRARAVWTEAQKYFADDAAGLAQVRAAAEALGVAN